MIQIGKISPFSNHYRYPSEEQLDNPEKMLFEQLVILDQLNRFPGHGVLSITNKHGNAFLGESLGIKMRVVNDTTYPERYLTDDEIKSVELPDDLTDIPIIKNKETYTCRKSIKLYTSQIKK